MRETYTQSTDEQNKNTLDIILVIVFIIVLVLIYYLFGYETLLNNIFLISVYAVIVAIIFFTFGAYIEKLIVQTQVENLIDEVLDPYQVVMDKKPDINIDPGGMDKLDEEVKQNNSDLVSKARVSLGSFCLVGLIIVIIMYIRKNDTISLKDLFIRNGILLIAVVTVELLFFGIITKNFRTLSLNKTKMEVIRAIKNGLTNTDNTTLGLTDEGEELVDEVKLIADTLYNGEYNVPNIK